MSVSTRITDYMPNSQLAANPLPREAGRRSVIRVLALVPYPTGRAPGQRYRIEQWAPLLDQEGVRITFSAFLSGRGMDVLYEPGHVRVKSWETLRGYMKRLAEALQGTRADVIFVYREAALLGPAWIERLLALRRPLVFDFDDAVYLSDTSQANAWSRGLKSAAKAETICRVAHHVTVGNEVLARYAKDRARAVTVVPSTIDTGVYQMRPRAQNHVPVIGWTGSVTTAPYLVALAPALRRLRQKQEFELRVIGTNVDVAELAVRCLPWRAETEPDDLRPLDVGLMPLPDDEWSRGKCGMKALQYMALGIVPIVSPVGVNTTIVRDGVNGFYARSDEEWVDRIERLLGDESLRRRMGAEGRRTVESSYSHHVHAPRMARVLREAASELCGP
jgi:glycosyltransferase involved in cell wall biosynthesis